MKPGAPVLLVEDDEVDVMTVRRAFEKSGVANPLHAVGNGEEALAFLRNRGPFADKAKYPRPSIILLDINMPIMNGIEFLREAKADPDLRLIPVIVLTTSRVEGDRLDCFALGVAGFIVKPLESGDFIAVAEAISRYWGMSELAGGTGR